MTVEPAGKHLGCDMQSAYAFSHRLRRCGLYVDFRREDENGWREFAQAGCQGEALTRNREPRPGKSAQDQIDRCGLAPSIDLDFELQLIAFVKT